MRNAALAAAAALLLSGTLAAQEEVRQQQPQELRADWSGTTVTSPEAVTIGHGSVNAAPEEARSFNFHDQELPAS